MYLQPICSLFEAVCKVHNLMKKKLTAKNCKGLKIDDEMKCFQYYILLKFQIYKTNYYRKYQKKALHLCAHLRTCYNQTSRKIVIKFVI